MVSFTKMEQDEIINKFLENNWSKRYTKGNENEM